MRWMSQVVQAQVLQGDGAGGVGVECGAELSHGVGAKEPGLYGFGLAN